jgi:hypothetical protein
MVPHQVVQPLQSDPTQATLTSMLIPLPWALWLDRQAKEVRVSQQVDQSRLDCKLDKHLNRVARLHLDSRRVPSSRADQQVLRLLLAIKLVPPINSSILSL